MRVVEVLSGLGLGGAEISLAQRLQHQPSHVSTSVISSGPSVDMIRNRIRQTGASVVELPRQSSPQELISAIRTQSPDVVITHTPRATFKILSQHQSLGSTPVVVAAHGQTVSDSPHMRIPIAAGLRLVNPRATLHIAVSQAAANGPWCHCAQHIEVCHLGSEIDLLDDESIVSTWPNETELRLLVLSRFVITKNLARLLKAVRRIREPFRDTGAHLALVGEGPERERLQAAIRRYEITDIVSLHPYSPVPSSLLRRTDWLVIPSTHEGGPLTAFEAQLVGTRLAATRVGVIPDIAQLDPSSVTAPAHTVTDLTRLLNRVLETGPLNEVERQRRAEAGRRWSIEHTAPRWYQLIQRRLS